MAIDAGIVSAYGFAVAHGYTGTPEQFGEDQANFAANAQQVREDKKTVEELIESIPPDYTTTVEKVDTVTDVIGNLFSDSEAMGGATGITRASASEYVGTASAFQTFLLNNYTLDETAEAYTIAFDIYTEANSSSSGTGLEVQYGNHSSKSTLTSFDNDQTDPYHFESFFSKTYAPTVADRTLGLVFKANSAPNNIWHVSNIRLFEGSEIPDAVTAKDIDAREKVDEAVKDLKDLKSALNSVNSSMLKIGTRAKFVFGSGQSTNSDLYLTAGKTYTFVNLSKTVIGGALYIAGYTSVSKTLAGYGTPFEFTPQNDGYLRYYDGNVSSGTIFEIAVVGLLEDKANKPYVKTVGLSGYDYTSLTACINALPTDPDIEKIIYVHAGEYDVYNEIGGDAYIATLDGTESWRSVNTVIPVNTKIIGIGRVVLKFNCPDSISSDVAVLLSCINASKNLTLENVNIECKNLRYAVHLEGSGLTDYNESSFELKNCSFVRETGTYSNSVIGVGLNNASALKIDQCRIENKNNDSCLLAHGNNDTLGSSSHICVSNSALISSGTSLYLLVIADRHQVIDTFISGTYLGALIYKANGSPGQNPYDNFAITMVNTTDVQVSASTVMQNVIETKKYNPIPVSS